MHTFHTLHTPHKLLQSPTVNHAMNERIRKTGRPRPSTFMALTYVKRARKAYLRGNYRKACYYLDTAHAYCGPNTPDVVLTTGVRVHLSSLIHQAWYTLFDRKD